MSATRGIVEQSRPRIWNHHIVRFDERTRTAMESITEGTPA